MVHIVGQGLLKILFIWKLKYNYLKDVFRILNIQLEFSTHMFKFKWFFLYQKMALNNGIYDF